MSHRYNGIVFSRVRKLEKKYFKLEKCILIPKCVNCKVPNLSFSRSNNDCQLKILRQELSNKNQSVSLKITNSTC